MPGSSKLFDFIPNIRSISIESFYYSQFAGINEGNRIEYCLLFILLEDNKRDRNQVLLVCVMNRSFFKDQIIPATFYSWH